MIVEAFLRVLGSIVGFFIGLLPTVPVPSWLSNSDGWIGTLVGYAASLGAWMPWSLALTVTPVVLGCIAVGFAIKVTRIALSFLTAGGGSAA